METGIPLQALDRILKVLAQYPEISTAVLYGSRALGTYKNGSDIDITLKGTELETRILNQIEEELEELLLPWMIDINLYERIENKELINHIKDYGIQVYPT
ncbi:MAG: nucleotidyltransferase domain-containing protein [Verrucomicrobia bacterium]|nr:MAG: nucleotidyltransferase domain-containing protein [Verrucomicrobiota bacterium]